MSNTDPIKNQGVNSDTREGEERILHFLQYLFSFSDDLYLAFEANEWCQFSAAGIKYLDLFLLYVSMFCCHQEIT